MLSSWTFLEAIGAICIFRLLFTLFSNLYIQFAGIWDYRKRLTSYGSWAVITGATRGIGLEFADRLADLGLNLLLVGRQPREKLDSISNRLRSKYSIECEVVILDFASSNPAAYDDLQASIRTKDIGILINSAGVMHEGPEYFTSLTEEDIQRMIQVNCTANTLVAHVVARRMTEMKKGLIVFLSSVAGDFSAPLLSIYGATKAFISRLSESIGIELRESGIIVQSLVPFYVATDMTAYSTLLNKPSILSPSAGTYVKFAMWTLGRDVSNTGYFPHDFVQWSILFPRSICSQLNFWWQKYLKRVASQTK